jgi:hypothetical protein
VRAHTHWRPHSHPRAGCAPRCWHRTAAPPHVSHTPLQPQAFSEVEGTSVGGYSGVVSLAAAHATTTSIIIHSGTRIAATRSSPACRATATVALPTTVNCVVKRHAAQGRLVA